MEEKNDQVFSRNVVEFVAVANEFCRYAEHASELGGDELLRVFQRILPLLYLKASLIPKLEPFFEEGNEKFVTEAGWTGIEMSLRAVFGTANDYPGVSDEGTDDTGLPVVLTISEDIADIYQDMKDFLLLYQTGTNEVMNDALWECRMNFENIWGYKLVNALKAIHMFIYSGKSIEEVKDNEADDTVRDTSEWFITKRQKDYREDGEE